jgi:nucleotide-binding universal stress UspA family protein
VSFATSIVVATDLSEAAHGALAEAARIARAASCPVALLHVIELPAWLPEQQEGPQAASLRRRIAEEAHGATQSVLWSLRERFFAGLEAVAIRSVEHASVVQGICAVVQEAGADLLVLASHGRAGASAVTEQLVRVAPCRLLVVPAAPRAGFAPNRAACA